MVEIHINCDVGEDDEIDRSIDFGEFSSYLSAVNIACGFHAGNPSLIAEITEECVKESIQIGLHPSYNDRKNFGRVDLDVRPVDLYNDVLYQLHATSALVRRYGGNVTHVKPHGALYNRTSIDDKQCAAVYQAIADFDDKVYVYGLPNTKHEIHAMATGLSFKSEGFGDRSYQKVDKLSSRKNPGSLLLDPKDVIDQITLLAQGKIKTFDDGVQPVLVDTICIHGDNKNLREILVSVHDHFHILKAHDIH